jgi:hypothetical protein
MNVEKYSKFNGCSVRDEKDRLIRYYLKSKVKQSLYTPWRRLGGEEV